jgi:hypothetical protein
MMDRTCLATDDLGGNEVSAARDGALELPGVVEIYDNTAPQDRTVTTGSPRRSPAPSAPAASVGRASGRAFIFARGGQLHAL